MKSSLIRSPVGVVVVEKSAEGDLLSGMNNDDRE